jgi:hypothetical protein
LDIAPKTAAATAAGSVSIAFVSILDWILGFWHISLTATVAAALATIFAAVASYFAPKSQQPTPSP